MKRGAASGSTPPKYLPIIPKPPPEELPPPKPVLRFCPVPVCRRINCNLRSHRQYKPKALRTLRQNVRKGSCDDQPTETHGSFPLVKGGVDAYPSLPAGLEDTPLWRELLHDWCNDLYARAAVLLVPPSHLPRGAAQLEIIRKGQIGAALTNSLVFYNFIAAAHYTRVSCQLRDGTNIRATALIYGQIMRVLRSKLQDFDPAEAAQMLLVILTLVMFDVSSGATDSLELHRTAMIHLVSSQGGIHNCDDCIPYILCLDRLIAIFTGTTPTLTHLSDLGPIRRVPRHRRLYGTFFENPLHSQDIDGEVLAFCLDTCRAIEILEGENFNFEPHDYRESSEIHYFYFLRDQLEDQFAHLNARVWDMQPISRAMLLTAKVVEYIVLMNNYLVYLPVYAAEKLRKSFNTLEHFIQEDDLWNGFILWIALTVASMPKSPWKQGREWALDLANTRLSMKYGPDRWPEMWKETEEKSLHQFVWSTTRLGKTLMQAFEDLETRRQKIGCKVSFGEDSSCDTASNDSNRARGRPPPK